MKPKTLSDHRGAVRIRGTNKANITTTTFNIITNVTISKSLAKV